LRIFAEQQRSYGAGDKVIREDESSDHVYRLRTGWACRSRQMSDGRRQIIAVFLPGEIFGVKSMLLRKQPDSIVAMTPITVNYADQTTVRRLSMANVSVALRLMYQLGEDERRLHNWVVGLGRATADEKLAAMLLELRGRMRLLNLIRGDSYRLPMTQRDIGDFLGLTPVHVNRIVRRLRESGIATLRHGVVVIHNVAALQRIASPVQDTFDREALRFESLKETGAVERESVASDQG
jgi:CRP-like cAMP-binding protein